MKGIVESVLSALILASILFKGGPNPPGFAVNAIPEKIEPTQYSTSICLNRGEIPPEEAHWLAIPASASELHTEINYGYLAGQLIKNGYVDAKSCPGGGIGLNGYANACGLAAAKPAVVQIQNEFDDTILEAARDTGVPPVAIKQLIRFESQFWPGQFGYHFGLGHVTFFGAHTALQWSPILAQIACQTAYGAQCGIQPVDEMMVGAFMGMMSATCVNCQYGIDEERARQSIIYLSHVMLAYCRQSAQVIGDATQHEPEYIVDYPMMWKLTLFSYNAGSSCLAKAVNNAYGSLGDEITDWDTFTEYVDDEECKRGIDYVNNITAPFYNFSP